LSKESLDNNYNNCNKYNNYNNYDNNSNSNSNSISNSISNQPSEKLVDSIDNPTKQIPIKRIIKEKKIYSSGGEYIKQSSPIKQFSKSDSVIPAQANKKQIFVVARDNKINLNNTSEEDEDESEYNYEVGIQGGNIADTGKMGNLGNILETKVQISPYENSRNINEVNDNNSNNRNNNENDKYGINEEGETYCTPVKKKNSIYYA